eukprot:12271985-Alexandrium_andersonii.AAC.1
MDTDARHGGEASCARAGAPAGRCIASTPPGAGTRECCRMAGTRANRKEASEGARRAYGAGA